MFENILAEGIGIILGLIATALGVGLYLNKRFTKWLTKHKLRRGVLATSDVYDLLQDTQHKIGAKKGMLIAAHNGGSFINPLHPPQITMLAETYDLGVIGSKASWQNRIADQSIVNLLSEILNKGEVVHRVEGLEGALQRGMLRDNTKGMLVKYIDILGVMVVFVVFTFDDYVKKCPASETYIEDFAHMVKSKY